MSSRFLCVCTAEGRCAWMLFAVRGPQKFEMLQPPCLERRLFVWWKGFSGCRPFQTGHLRRAFRKLRTRKSSEADQYIRSLDCRKQKAVFTGELKETMFRGNTRHFLTGEAENVLSEPATDILNLSLEQLRRHRQWTMAEFWYSSEPVRCEWLRCSFHENVFDAFDCCGTSNTVDRQLEVIDARHTNVASTISAKNTYGRMSRDPGCKIHFQSYDKLLVCSTLELWWALYPSIIGGIRVHQWATFARKHTHLLGISSMRERWVL